MTYKRHASAILITFLDGETDSNTVQLANGCFGTFIVPTGSDAIAKTLQAVAIADEDQVSTPHPDTALLSTAKTLAAGANALSADEVREMGAARNVIFRLSAVVTEDTNIWLYWKD